MLMEAGSESQGDLVGPAAFFGYMGVSCALVFASNNTLLFRFNSYCKDLGAAYGTAKSGVGISSMGVLKPDLIMKSIIPVVMAGILGIYLSSFVKKVRSFF